MDTLTEKGIDLGRFDVGFLGYFGAGDGASNTGGGRETGGEVFTAGTANTSSSLTSPTTVSTGATVTPEGTTSTYTGSGAPLLSGTSKPTLSGGQKKVEWVNGFLVMLAVLGLFA
jgi:hypothetical protein